MVLLKIDANDLVQEFFEKPTDPDILTSFKLDAKFFEHKKIEPKQEDYYLGSMGIYVFKRDALFQLLETDPRADFGKNLIPTQIKKGKTAAFYYNGYWEDIGTISSYYEATLALTKNNLGLDLYNEALPIFSNAVHLPCARVTNTKVDHAILSQGSIIEAQEISHSLLGLRCIVKQGTVIKNSIVVGNQFYSPPTNWTPQLPSEFTIGQNCLINKTIIDEHVQIGDNVKLINKNNLTTYDGQGVFIRDGIIIISAGTTLPNGFVL